MEIVFPSWQVGFTSFLQIGLCHSVLEFYARKLCCTLWSSMEEKRAGSSSGYCHIHLVTGIDTVIFRYDFSCEAKWLIKQWILRFLCVFSYVYLQESHMKGDLPSEIFLHYTPGAIIWIYMGPRPLHMEKIRFFFYKSNIWAVVFSFQNVVYVSR